MSYRLLKIIFLTTLFLVFVNKSLLGAENNPGLPTVTIVTTGGTIAEKIDPRTGAAVPSVSGDDLIKAVPGLSKIANIQVVNFSNIDSSQMTPQIWYKLSQTIEGILRDPKVTGVVVTHGTDTMAEGAYFLDLTLTSNKPVVFVGAMRDASDLSADGPLNLLNAVKQVCSKQARNWGVTVTLNQYINSARNVIKTQSTNVQTFNSGEKGYLGYIEGDRIIRFNDRPPRLKLGLPKKLAKVFLIKTFPGDDGILIRYAVKSGAQGIVVEGVGAGNVNSQVYEAIKYALKKGVAVVLTTSVYQGGVFPIYGDQGGGKTLEQAGVILGGDLTGPKAYLLLMLALPQVKNQEQLKEIFTTTP